MCVGCPLFFGKFSLSFRTIFGKFKNQQETLGKRFWSNFVKNNFSDNCQQIVGECLEYFRFFHIINYLLTGLLVPYSEILSPRFFTHRPRKLSPDTSKPRLSISQYSPYIWLINSKLEDPLNLPNVPNVRLECLNKISLCY